jgi:hypothetical protein
MKEILKQPVIHPKLHPASSSATRMLFSFRAQIVITTNFDAWRCFLITGAKP